MDEILMLQEEITELQTSLAQELVSEPLDAEAADQLALQSTLTVLAERMATIRMKASGKRQLLEVQEKKPLEAGLLNHIPDFARCFSQSCTFTKFLVTTEC